MIAKRLCPICETKEVELLHNQRFELLEGHPLSTGYDVVVCSSCGFVYADTIVTQSDYDRFYSEYSKYEDSKTSTGGVDNPYDWKRQQETAQQIVDFLQNPKASILDVGCANGGMLKALKEIGYEVLCGIDPSPACVENTRTLGIEAQVGSLFQPFKEHAYDCVILSHTLEHVQDVIGALEWIEKRLKSGGVVYLETPDATRYLDFIYAPLQDFNTEHINHFSLICLENLMHKRGFTISSGGAKELETVANIFYPAIFGFWEKSDLDTPTLFKKDNDLKIRIEEYIRRSKKIMNSIDSQISSLIKQSPSVYVWGTGQLTMKLLAETSLSQADVLAFVDKNPINQGKVLLGKQIIAPNVLMNVDAPIIVATLLHHASIAKQIKDMGLKNEIVFLQGDW